MMATMKARSEKVVQHIDVGGDSRDQAAHGVAIVEGDVQALEVRHELLAQIEHGELAGVLHEIGLRESEDERAEQYAEIEQAHGG
jgi:hypothetical protein